MTIDSKNLSVLAYSNGFTLWHYKTVDEQTVVQGVGYFNKVASILNVGDLLVTSMDIDRALTTIIYVVISVVDGVVSISTLN